MIALITTVMITLKILTYFYKKGKTDSKRVALGKLS